MIDDPYKVLGIDRDATDEQIKQAYRRLAKKYHPDLNPGDAEAAQKMQQVNAAYEQIKNPEKAAPNPGAGAGSYGSYGGYYTYDPFRGWQQHSRQEQSAADRYQQSAYQYILYGRYQEALNVLSNAPQRNARWYYLSALANDALGNQITALEHLRKAVSMEPDNETYLDALGRMESGGSAYRQRSGQFRGFFGNTDLCSQLCLCYLAQMFCCRCC